ncbi:MAG: aromatic amino acid hydroxylase [Bacteroidales bacterium]|nr:aromatic amino acid hydroxylase [Bacteroidales bacterium]
MRISTKKGNIMEMNKVLDKLPKHLMSLVIDQPYNDYTEQDHAVWRYVMRQNVKYLSRVAHGSYLEGLQKTGIGIERIPHMYGMNRILKEIGWAAVAVDGFIPPAAFMEFQAYKVLVIAADIRPINQIEYTPAPDIIHEAAGHAPIIANPDYAEYLRVFGEIGSKALSSAKDYAQYEAIRYLSILKADPYSSKADIEKAEKTLEIIGQNIGGPSEMSLIRNLHWWTVEYGLVGDLYKPKIYGAGLLSSIGESFSCLKDDVEKLPYSIDAVNYNFDITNRQPQLFVTPDFEYLTTVLNQFADRMALRRGGLYGIQKAIESENVATCVFSSGLQVSGIFSDALLSCERLAFIKTSSPTQLSHSGTELPGHGKNYHRDGFGAPVGNLKKSEIPPELLSVNELIEIGIVEEEDCLVEFESGIILKGKLENILRKEDKNLLFTFTNCLVKFEDRTLFEPSWGKFDMAVGQRIESVYTGPADAEAFGLEFPVPKEKTHKIIHSESSKNLHDLYRQVRDIREKSGFHHLLPAIWDTLKKHYPDEWLLPMEILEISKKQKQNSGIAEAITKYLIEKQEENKDLVNLVSNGLSLINE